MGRRSRRWLGGVALCAAVTAGLLHGCESATLLGPDFEILEAPAAGAKHPRRIRHIPSGIVLIYVGPGEFRMGSPPDEHDRRPNEAQRPVKIDRGFYLAETETTVAQWKRVTTTEAPFEQPSDEHPASSISWHATRDFLSRLAALGAGTSGWSLPSEMQWEYACRAGTTTAFSFGEDITTEQVNYHGHHPYRPGAKQLFRRGSVAVKSFPPNAWGFYDMHGNVWEWCEERYVADLQSGKQPDMADPGAARPIRGGGFEASAERSRSAFRDGYPPSSDGEKYGFRVALEIR